MILILLFLIVLITITGACIPDNWEDSWGVYLFAIMFFGLIGAAISSVHHPHQHTDRETLAKLDSGEYVQVIGDDYLFNANGEAILMSDGRVEIVLMEDDHEPYLEVERTPWAVNLISFEIADWNQYTLYIPSDSVKIVK